MHDLNRRADTLDRLVAIEASLRRIEASLGLAPIHGYVRAVRSDDLSTNDDPFPGDVAEIEIATETGLEEGSRVSVVVW